MYHGSQFGYSQPRVSQYGGAQQGQMMGGAYQSQVYDLPSNYRPSTEYVGVPAIYNESPSHLYQSTHSHGPVCDHFSSPQYSSYVSQGSYGSSYPQLVGRSSYQSHNSGWPHAHASQSHHAVYPQSHSNSYRSSYYPSTQYISGAGSGIGQPRLSYRGY